jgi:polyhydroxyalkanoate synthesis regulator phasin
MIDLVKKGMLAGVGLAVVTKDKVLASKLFNDFLHRANVVTKDQYDALAARVTELEGRLHKEFPNGD